MRGRVMALRLAVLLGSTPIGAPIVGWVADTAGPRWALGVAAVSGIAAALVGFYAREKLSVRTVNRSRRGGTEWQQPPVENARTKF
jgi:MFS family permease